MPFTVITGTVYPDPPFPTTPDERRAALGRWISLIARDVGRHYETHTERTAAEAFARSHRLSIAHAFERKLCRKDVVTELMRMFAEGTTQRE